RPCTCVKRGAVVGRSASIKVLYARRVSISILFRYRVEVRGCPFLLNGSRPKATFSAHRRVRWGAEMMAAGRGSAHKDADFSENLCLVIWLRSRTATSSFLRRHEPSLRP